MKIKNPRKVVEVELLAIDLSSCTRCVGSLKNIETVIKTVEKELKASGARVKLVKTLIDSEKAARDHAFLSSPTIRVNGEDLTLDTVENKCDSCSDLCGCEGGTDCRIWRYKGKDYTEAPKEMIVEALRRALKGGATAAKRPNYSGAPENLKRFFAGKNAKAASKPCCGPVEKKTCCAPFEKTSCCGDAGSGKCSCSAK